MESIQLNSVKEFEDVKDYYLVCRDGDQCWLEGKTCIRTANYDQVGYRRYVLSTIKDKKLGLEHRIFALCFIPNPEDKEQVNHIDGIKSNNSLSNLEWNTQSENMYHAYRTGLQKPLIGENHGSAKLKDSEISLIFDMRKTGITQKAIGDHFGVSQKHISDILSGKYRQILC
jgi:hypothetical protein